MDTERRGVTEHSTVSVTCLSDGRAHAVLDAELAGPAACSGYYKAVCGHLVTPAPMVEPEGDPCRQCSDAGPAQQRPPHRGRAHRLLGL